MIKFRNLLDEILLEDKEDELLKIGQVWKEKLPGMYQRNLEKYATRAGELRDKLNDGEWLIPDTKPEILYRGTVEAATGWKVRKIRKDRRPKDTEEWVDGVLEEVRQKYYFEIPSRRNSKFAASSQSGLEEVKSKYGEPNVVFPEKDAEIYSRYQDAITYTNGIDESAGELADEIFEVDPVDSESFDVFEDEYPKVADFCLAVFEVKKRGGDYILNWDWSKHPQRLAHKAEEARKFLENSREKFSGDQLDYELGKLAIAAEEASNLLENIVLYFSDMQEGVEPNSGEVLFSGEKYVRVHFDFWKYFMKFDFESGKVRVNKLIRSYVDSDSDQLSLPF